MTRAMTPFPCRTGKRRYPSLIVAEKKLAWHRDNWDESPERMPRRAYPCNHYKSFHLTSKEFEVR